MRVPAAAGGRQLAGYIATGGNIETLVVLGRDRSLTRLEAALKRIEAAS